MILAGSTLCFAQEANTPKQIAMPQQVESSNAAALRMFAQLSKPGKDMFFSPYSISQALGMTYAGARANTAAEIAAALGFSDAGSTAKNMSAIAAALAANNGENKIETANSFWAQDGVAFLPEYLKVLGDSYGAEAHTENFSDNVKAASDINGWVSKETQKLIPEVLPASAIDALTRLILVNSIYFKGVWQDKFLKEDTRNDTFHGPVNSILPFMHSSKRCRYADINGVQVLEKNYKGGEFAMQILLPDKADGLAQLEASLSDKGLSQYTTGLAEVPVELSLPKFKSDFSIMLNEPLIALGIKDAFSVEKADFSGMDGKTDLYISKVMHRAVVDVDEEGTKAAAATAVVMKLKAMHARITPVVFNADHPFVYVIRHIPTGTILFMGEFGKEKPVMPKA
jgi:serpin B